MKRFTLILTMAFSLVLGNQLLLKAEAENLTIRIRTLNTDEAQYQLRNLQHWMEIEANGNSDLATFKIIDRLGYVKSLGKFQNGFAYVDISQLPLGRYEIILIDGENQRSQKLEIL